MDCSEVARAALVAKADQYFWGLIGSTVILFVGAIMEDIHPLDRLPTHDVNIRTRVRTPRNWVIRSQTTWRKIAIVFVVIGIGGEGIFEYRVARAESAVRCFDNEIAVQAEADAGKAEKSANNAATDAQNAQGSADKAKAAGDTAQNEANELLARVTEEEAELDVVNPRLITIGRHADELVKAVAPFEDQKVSVTVCGNSDSKDPVMEEQRDTRELLQYLLTVVADWDRPNVTQLDWPDCDSVVGVVVSVDVKATPRTKEAAAALSGVLSRVLPEQQQPMLDIPKEEFPHVGHWHGIGPRPIAIDPNVVRILVGMRSVPLPMEMAQQIAKARAKGFIGMRDSDWLFRHPNKKIGCCPVTAL